MFLQEPYIVSPHKGCTLTSSARDTRVSTQAQTSHLCMPSQRPSRHILVCANPRGRETGESGESLLVDLCSDNKSNTRYPRLVETGVLPVYAVGKLRDMVWCPGWEIIFVCSMSRRHGTLWTLVKTTATTRVSKLGALQWISAGIDRPKLVLQGKENR